AALMLDEGFDQLSYLDDPAGQILTPAGGSPARLPSRGGVLVVRVRNLELRGHNDPGPAMRRLGELGRRVLDGLQDAENVEECNRASAPAGNGPAGRSTPGSSRTPPCAAGENWLRA